MSTRILKVWRLFRAEVWDHLSGFQRCFLGTFRSTVAALIKFFTFSTKLLTRRNLHVEVKIGFRVYLTWRGRTAARRDTLGLRHFGLLAALTFFGEGLGVFFYHLIVKYY